MPAGENFFQTITMSKIDFSTPTGSVEEKIGFYLRTSKYMFDCDGG